MTGDQETYVLRMLEESKNFTEEILTENRHLRSALAELRATQRPSHGEVEHLKTLVASLEHELEQTRHELTSFKDNMESMQEENKQFAQQYLKIEKQNSQLASMYVASYRIHSTLDFESVIEIIKEVVINLIGSEHFAIYVHDEKANALLLIGQECNTDFYFEELVKLGKGVIGTVAAKGETLVADLEDANRADGNEPIAIVPLMLEETVIGAIVIYQLLIQKDGFEALDLQLFDLLASHAAAAIYSARQYTLSKRKLNTLQGLMDLMKLQEQ